MYRKDNDTVAVIPNDFYFNSNFALYGFMCFVCFEIHITLYCVGCIHKIYSFIKDEK